MIESRINRHPIDRLAFISDLHLFSNRCTANEHLDLIARTVDEADLCVWGGDLFDFRWSRLPSESQSVDAAIRWLQDWYDRFPATEFVFLDGNHDAHAAFSRELASWAGERSRFQSGLNCIRVNDVLLLHGDVTVGKGCPDAFAQHRGRWENKPNAGALANRFYDMAIATRVHRAAAAAAHRRRDTCIRLIRWMHRQPDDATRGVRRIVFGHTHRPLYGYRCQGLEFYNGGAAIRHVPFRPIKLDVPTP